MIKVSLPDGSVREYEDGASPFDVAKSISNSLAKKALAALVDGELRDLMRPLEGDASIEIVTANDADGLELIRHDAAHVLAQAVQELYPDAQVTIGPVIDDGFYYDFAREEPFSTEDFEKIEKKMREIVDADYPSSAKSGRRKMPSRRSRRSAKTTRLRSSTTSSRRASQSRSTSRVSGSICAGDRICHRRANCPKPSN